MNTLNYHDWIDQISILLFNGESLWFHSLAHALLVILPISLFFILILLLINFILRNTLTHNEGKVFHYKKEHVLSERFLCFLYKYSLKSQIILCFLSLLILPITYISFELPKQIINNAIDFSVSAKQIFSFNLGQVDYLLLLCALFLSVLMSNGIMKYYINFYKGLVSERLIKILRIHIYYANTSEKQYEKELIPVLAQEVEPVGGFAGGAFSTPFLQGGIMLTIIIFMMVQNLVLGISAILLLPVQIVIIPRIQKKINSLIRKRVLLIRKMSNNILTINMKDSQSPELCFENLKMLRIEIFRKKYFMKSLNNFLMNMTPFLFYLIGGFLVIKESLSLGALIASLASYKELSSSIKELFSYYQNMHDVIIRYSEILKFTKRLNPLL